MTYQNARSQRRNFDSGISLSKFNRFNLIDLVHQAIAQAQPLALGSDLVIIFEIKPPNAMVFADGQRIRHTLDVLFTDAIRKTPKGRAISVKVLFQELQIMIVVEDGGDGMNRQTIDLISDDFDRVTWPDAADPTDVTLPCVRTGVDGAVLHIRKLAAAEQFRGPENAVDAKSSIRAVLAFPRLTFH